MTEPARLIGVFFEPGKVFADLSQKPRWIVPILISILIGLAFVYAITTHVGWDTTFRHTFASNPKVADMTVAQREQIIATSAKIASIGGWIGAFFGAPLTALVIAGVLTGLFNALLGTDLKFAQTFAITAYALLVRALLAALMILLIYLKPPEEFNIQVSPFSPAAYISRTDTPKWLYSLASSLDLFTLWTIILLAIGFSVASKKLAFSKCLTAIVIPWLFVVAAIMSVQSFQ